MSGYENAGKGCVLFAMGLYSARVCGEGGEEGCGELLSGEWGGVG